MNLRDLILAEYYDFMRENNLEDKEETIDLFLAYIYYEIQDNLDELYDIYNIPKDLEGIEAQKFVEAIIKDIIKFGE